MRADYYQLLEVQPEAPAKELKAAYYRLALRYHPDRNVGDPDAEEHFKLVAEAYRTLGVPERRREYDNWLHLHNLYQGVPELERMSAASRIRPFRYSSRRARERQARRMGSGDERPRSRRRVGGFLFRESSRVNTWMFFGFYALLALNLLPIFFRHMVASPAPVVKKEASAAEAEVNEVVVRRRLLEMEQALRQRAEAGEAAAQYQLGLYLFNKSSRGRGAGTTPSVLRRAASASYRQEALLWFGKAAEQGHGMATRLLKRLSPARTFSSPSL